MEPIRIDLNNSIVVGSVSGNTKADGSRHVLVQCMRVLTVKVRVQVRVHCFKVQVLKICTRVQVQVPSTTTLQINAQSNYHLRGFHWKSSGNICYKMLVQRIKRRQTFFSKSVHDCDARYLGKSQLASKANKCLQQIQAGIRPGKGIFTTKFVPVCPTVLALHCSFGVSPLLTQHSQFL